MYHNDFYNYFSNYTCALPVNQDVQHSLGGGEGAIGGEEDGDEGGVAHGEGMKEMEDQLFLCPCFDVLRTGCCGLGREE